MNKNKGLDFEKLRKSFAFILESVHEKPEVLPSHFHNAYQLLYIIRGKGSLFLIDEKFAIGKGDLALIKKKEKHEIVDDKNDLISHYSIYFQEAEIAKESVSLSRYIRNLDADKRVFSTNGSPYLIKIPLLIREVLFEENHWSGDSNLIQKIKIIEILISLKKYASHKEHAAVAEKQKHSQTERNVLGAIEYLENNYYKDFSLDEISAMSFVSKRQFDRVFRRFMGAGFIEYLNRIRIEQAKKLFASSEKEIITVCFDVGFNDLSYFYRVFKKHAACTPREYKNAIAAGGLIGGVEFESIRTS